jgi:NAD(P)-dependent dehydrogenase (short-subunit alcohol dehydrogenase family)
MQKRTALLTGATRGIGLEAARQLGLAGHRVVITGRDPKALDHATAELRAKGVEVRGELLDVTRPEDVEACARVLDGSGEHIDVLVNNAAIYPAGSFLGTSAEVLRSAFETNFWGAVWAARAWVPTMNRRGFGRVVNVSSGSGSLTDALDGPAAYALSKAALNALTIKLATEVRGDVKVNAVCPGWVRTRMGGALAPRSVREGADTVVWLATLPSDGPSGGFFRDRERIPW